MARGRFLRKVMGLIMGLAVLATSVVVPSGKTYAAGEEVVSEMSNAKVGVIKVFDLNDPHLVEVTDSGEGNANDIVLYTTSRPTRHYNLENSGQYRYSAYSNRNIMWTKYIFDTNNGSFRVYGRFNKKPFNIIFHNCSNNRDYKYAITSDSEFDYYQFEVMNGTAPRSFYFGIDTKSTRSAVSVNGFVDTY